MSAQQVERVEKAVAQRRLAEQRGELAIIKQQAQARQRTLLILSRRCCHQPMLRVLS